MPLDSVVNKSADMKQEAPIEHTRILLHPVLSAEATKKLQHVRAEPTHAFKFINHKAERCSIRHVGPLFTLVDLVVVVVGH